MKKGLKFIKRVSYNGHYVSFPRIKRGFDSLYPHQEDLADLKKKISLKIFRSNYDIGK